MMFYDRLTLFSPHLMPNSIQSFDDMSCLSFEKQRNVYALTQRILTVWIDWKCVSSSLLMTGLLYWLEQKVGQGVWC